jgi:antimicrobial peptide system SdpB family protein
MKSLIEFYLYPIKSSVHTNVYGFARTLLALSTLLTLLFNNTSILFAEGVGVNPPLCMGLSKLSIYCFLNTNLELARFFSIIILIIIASGWRPMITGIFHWWITFSLNSTALILEGGDQVAAVFTLLLLPICLTDTRKWHWNSVPVAKADSIINDLSQFLGHSAYHVIRLQAAFIYFQAAIEKFKVDEWINGTALYYWFLNPYMGANDTMRFFVTPLFDNAILTPLATWGVLLFELLLFLGLVMQKKYRSILLVLGILFHLSIAIIHGLFPFFCSMSAVLILYLRPIDWRFEFDLTKSNFLASFSIFHKLMRN